jgi:uncharacterized protein (TIGR03792 family)
MDIHKDSSKMVIEWLKFMVAPQSREKFIEKDAEIWTSLLASYPGFLGKEVWLNPEIPEEVVLIIYWKTQDEWKSIPHSVLEETERKFSQAIGEYEYRLLEAAEYQVSNKHF